jgi:predicted transcriptional regulator of viral defense system
MNLGRIEKAKQIFNNDGPIIKTSAFRKNKFCSKDIAELSSGNYIRKVRTGYYIWATKASDISDMEVAVTVIKNGVICLFTAAQHYELTTVNPTAIDIAIPLSGKPPILPQYPPVNIYRIKKSIFSIGITEIEIGGRFIKVYDIERIVCDFFRLRRQIGEDVALEVLKNYMFQNRKNIQKLYDYASKMRIKTVIKPYVEALL